MALRINTNIAALNAHRNMVKNDTMLGNSLERLSSGLRINKAADDASGMAISDSLRAQSLGIGQAIRNANDGISIVQTADGALEESINIINVIRTKAIQAASDGQTTATRRAIQNDIDKLLEELDIIAKTTAFNGQKLLSGAFTDKTFQIGAYANETADISIGSTESSKIGHISQAQLSLASKQGGEVQLSIRSSITGETITLSSVDIQYNNNPVNGMGALADEINRYTAVTGINARAVVETTTMNPIKKGSTGADFTLNGVPIGAITVMDNDSDGALVNAINERIAETGVEAFTTRDGKLTLKSVDGRAIEITGSVSDVLGNTSSQLTTIGYLELTQKGVSQFQINGIGAGANGADITLAADLTTVEDSHLAAGSQIAAGSFLSATSIIGGDAIVEAKASNTQLDYTLKTGSTLYWASDLSVGTILGGNIMVGGDLGTDGTNVTQLTQDMLVTTGSKLEENTVLGKGTVVTTQFQTAAGGPTYAVGSTLSSAVTLGQALTLAADMTLVYNGNVADNTAIEIGSTINTGSVLGANFTDIGLSYSTATSGSEYTAHADLAGAWSTSGTATVTSSLMTVVDDFRSSGGDFYIPAGSLLADGTILNLATGNTTWTGPTLITTAGVIEAGDTISGNTGYTLDGAQVISTDFIAENASAGGTVTTVIEVGSILEEGFQVINATVGTAGVAANAQINVAEATLNNEMLIKSGSEIQAGSKILSGTKLGDATYVMGGVLNSTGTAVTTYARTEIKAGSKLQTGSVVGETSTIGGTITVDGATTITTDMTITAGSLLKANSLLKAGTIINQDMVLNKASTGAAATEVELSAGDILTTDLYVDDDTTVAEDILLREDSVIQDESELGVNTRDSGSLGLSDIESYNLADLSVLNLEDAQRAISITEAALKALGDIRSSLGSVQNQLNSTISNLSVTKSNIQASESIIRDVDFADESSVFSKMQLLAQTSSYALQQANASAQNIMSLLK